MIDLIPIDEEAPPVSQLAVPFKVLGMAVDVCKPLFDQKPQISQRRMKDADPVLRISLIHAVHGTDG